MKSKLMTIAATLIVIFAIPSATGSAYANIPAAYLACEGAELREDCVMTGPQYGICLQDTLCEDPSDTEVNECILCVDACWDQDEGSSCIRPWTGEEGVCEAQDQCTDKEETSFQECMRCVERVIPKATQEGCTLGVSRAQETSISLLSLILALGGALFIRRQWPV